MNEMLLLDTRKVTIKELQRFYDEGYEMSFEKLKGELYILLKRKGVYNDTTNQSRGFFSH